MNRLAARLKYLLRGDVGALDSPKPRRCSRHWRGVTVHICVCVDHASIPLGPFSHSRQYWYRAGKIHCFSLSVQPGISHSKLGGIPDAKEIPVVRVLSESPLSGSHLTEAASALTNKPPGADPRAALRIDWAVFVTEALAPAPPPMPVASIRSWLGGRVPGRSPWWAMLCVPRSDTMSGICGDIAPNRRPSS
jgi:hypothetical protein